MAFLGSVKPRMLFFPLIHVKMPTIGILTFMNGKNFMVNRDQHEISFITLGPRSGTYDRFLIQIRLKYYITKVKW